MQGNTLPKECYCIHSLSSGQVLKEPYTAELARLIVREMTELLVLDLVRKYVVTKKVTLTIGYDRTSVQLVRRGKTPKEDEYKVITTGKRYAGTVHKDHYGRPVPKHAHGTGNLEHWTSSTKDIVDTMMQLYDRIIDTDLLVRRVNICACDLIYERDMMESGGAVERIFNKVTSSANVNNQDTVAQFDPHDFVLTADYVEEMERAGADRKAVKLANWLIPNEEDGQEHAKRIADYLNQHVEEVIQSCAGIESGDFEQIFKEIRQELKRKGKKLTLLIEDITSFTGINQALLNVLITEHTGMNETDQMCRLVSVVGTTSEYYKQFRDNYRDRISTQITLQDESIGEQQLLLFVAK